MKEKKRKKIYRDKDMMNGCLWLAYDKDEVYKPGERKRKGSSHDVTMTLSCSFL